MSLGLTWLSLHRTINCIALYTLWPGHNKVVSRFGLVVRRQAGKAEETRFDTLWPGYNMVVSRFGLVVKRQAGKQKDLGSIRFGSPFP